VQQAPSKLHRVAPPAPLLHVHDVLLSSALPPDAQMANVADSHAAGHGVVEWSGPVEFLRAMRPADPAGLPSRLQ